MTEPSPADGGPGPSWWRKPRRIAVVVDNESWQLRPAQDLVALLYEAGDDATLYRRARDVPAPALVFYLGCISMVPKSVLEKHHRNLVIHAAALPEGRGWSPMTWQILQGRSELTISLFEAVEETDAGPIYFTDTLHFEGHELIDELRQAHDAASRRLIERFLEAPTPPVGAPQQGRPSFFPRRGPEDGRLDPHRPLGEQFDLLRTVDNDRYPAFFDFRGHRYRLRISKEDGAGE